MKATHGQSQFIRHALPRAVPAILGRPATPRNTLDHLWGSVGKLALLRAIFWFWTRVEAATVSSPAENGPDTLRAAIAAAQPVDTINFAAALSGSTITLTSGEIQIVGKNLTITGLGATNLTINGASLNKTAFHLVPANNNSPSIVAVTGLRFTGGFRGVDGLAGTAQNQDQDGKGGSPAAGGIFLNAAGCSLALSNCIMEHCYAIGGDGGNGYGGVFARPGMG